MKEIRFTLFDAYLTDCSIWLGVLYLFGVWVFEVGVDDSFSMSILTIGFEIGKGYLAVSAFRHAKIFHF